MSSPGSPADAESAAQQIEQLLAKAIGPMAKIVLARARKRSADDESLLDALAQCVDDEAERSVFIAAARRVIAERKRSGAADTLATAAPAQAPAPAAVPLAGSSAGAREPVAQNRPAPPRAAASDGGAMKPGAIFVSYARDNLGAAQHLVEGLRSAGLEVWLDLGKLQPGDAWDLKIRRNIEACSFFIPLVSRETEARQEGYFRREWNIAADRALNFADDVPFLLPVTIDDTAAYSARVPERFRGAHWTTLRGGEVTPEFVDHLKELVDDYRRRHPSP